MARITGTSGDDVLSGTSGNDTIDGGSGHDTITGGAGNDTMRGGVGSDYIADYSGSDSLDGGDGTDTLWIYREGGSDTLVLNGGNDNDDVFITYEGSGRITVNGGDGSDRINVGNLLGTLTISLGTSSDILTLYPTLFDPDGTSHYRWSGVTVTDFAVGPTGDVIGWAALFAMNLIGWDQSTNPFRSYVKLVKSGSDTLVQLDVDGAAAATPSARCSSSRM